MFVFTCSLTCLIFVFAQSQPLYHPNKVVLIRIPRQSPWNSGENHAALFHQQRNAFGQNNRIPNYNYDSDQIYFEDDFEDFVTSATSTTSAPVINRPTRPTNECQERCNYTHTTSEYNPICGTDDEDYLNISRLRCAQHCGKNVQRKYMGRCRRT